MIKEIICADSISLMKSFPANFVDLIVTSPPYNFGMEYDKYEDTKSWQKYYDFLETFIAESYRILKSGGRLCVVIQPLFSSYVPTHHIISNLALKKNFLFKAEILWEKNNYNCKYTAWGSWKSPSSPYLKYTWEFIEVFCKEQYIKTGDKENIDITADEFKKWVYAKWSIIPEHRGKEFNHPAMFPEEIPNRLIKLFSFKNDLVLDLFNGVGSTTFMAEKLDRQYIGIDISLEYCKKAKDRINGIL